MRLRTLFLSITLPLVTLCGRGEMVAPLNIPLVFSANFAELRPNHFHSGIDLKTQGRTGLPVCAMDEGYVARVSVSPWGFGRAVYINHPSGVTTVYAHLESFASFIDEVVRAKQYERESFTIDCEFAVGEIPVGQGDVIGLSGNSGSSGGPHLHLDIRDTETQDPLDPEEWLSPETVDKVAPEVRRLFFYAHNGITANATRRTERKAIRGADGVYSIGEPVALWGDVSLGIEAYDRMTGTTNKYGVHQVDLYIDDSLFFSTFVNRFSFDETRYINSYADEGKVMRTYIAPGNRLSTIYKQVANRGVFRVEEERIYRCRYELVDHEGNRSRVLFAIQGKIQEPVAPRKSGLYFSYAVENRYKKEDCILTIPEGALYENIEFTRECVASSKYHSQLHTLAPRNLSLHIPAELSLRLTTDTVGDSSKYYMVRINGERVSPVSGEYQSGWYTAKIKNLGTYAVAVDTVAPSIRPIAPEKWSGGTIRLKVADSGSGLQSYRGEIDGKFVLFELDGKSNRIAYTLERNRVRKGGRHTLRVVAVDMCGNEQVYTHTFTW